MARDTFEDADVRTATDGLGNGLIIITTLVLLASIFLMLKARGDHFGSGPLADKAAAPPADAPPAE